MSKWASLARDHFLQKAQDPTPKNPEIPPMGVLGVGPGHPCKNSDVDGVASNEQVSVQDGQNVARPTRLTKFTTDGLPPLTAINDTTEPLIEPPGYEGTGWRLAGADGLSPEALAKFRAASLALDAQMETGALLTSDPDRWCWPHSDAMTGAEIDTFTARLARFTNKGVIHIDAESLADKLVIRDRESDDRHLCLECTHMGGNRQSSWRCANWQVAGIALQARDAQLPADLVRQLQRCDGFNAHADRGQISESEANRKVQSRINPSS